MTQPGRPKTRRLVYITAVFAALLITGLGLYLYLVPIELTPYRERIETGFRERTTHHITTEKIVLRVLPTPELTIDGLKVLQLDGEPIFTAARARIKVNPVTLLFKTVYFHDIDIEGAVFRFTRFKNGKLNIERYRERHPPRKRLWIRSLESRNGTIHITDEMIEGGAAYAISGVKSKLAMTSGSASYEASGRFQADTPISVSGTMDLSTRERSGTVAAARLRLEDFAPYLTEPLAGGRASALLDLRTEYRLGAEKRFKGTLAYKDLEVNHPKVSAISLSSRSGSTNFSMLLGAKTKELALTDATISYAGVDISGRLNLRDSGTGPWLETELSTTAVPFAELKNMVPASLVPKRAAGVVDDVTPLGGELRLDRVFLSSPLSELGTGILSRADAFESSVELKDVSLKYAGIKEILTSVNGRVVFAGGVLSLVDINGSFDHGVIEDLDGEFRDVSGVLPFDLNIKGDFDISGSLGLLRTAAGKTKRALVKRLDKVSGSGRVSVDASISGSIKDELKYSGAMVFKEASLSYKGTAQEFESVNGRVGFDNNKLVFTDLAGRYSSSFFRVNGDVAGYSGPEPVFETNIQGSLARPTLELFMKEEQMKGLNFIGRIPFKADLSGNKEKFNAEVSIDLTPTDFLYRNIINKKSGYTVKLAGAVTRTGNTVKVKKADLVFGNSSVTVEGSTTFDFSTYRFTLDSEGVHLSDLDDVSPYFRSDFNSSGLLSLNITGGRKSGKKELFEGSAAISGGRFSTPMVAKPVDNVNARMTFKDNKASLDVESLNIGESMVAGNITVTDWDKRLIRFEVLSPRLNLSEILPKKADLAGVSGGVQAPPPTAEEKAARQEERRLVTGNGTIIIKEGDAWGHRFSNFFAGVKLFSSIIHLNPITMEIDGGRAEAELRYYRSTDDPYLFETSVKLADIDLKTFIAAFGTKAKVLYGELNGEGAFIGRRHAKPFTAGIDGDVMLTSQKGRLWKFLLMSKIFSIVNIFSIDELFREGLPYKDITGYFSIKDGIIRTDDFTLDSDSMRMSAAGSIDMPDKSINSIMVLHPFVTIDKIISNIPLAGWIITGKEKSAASLYFSIRGPLKNPKIEPAPIKTIEKNIFGVLQRLIEAPFEVLKPVLKDSGNDNQEKGK